MVTFGVMMISGWLSCAKLTILFLCLLLGPIESRSFADNAKVIDVSKVLSNMSKKDEIALTDFIKSILASSECGYVLYGSKPICFMGINTPGNDSLGSGHYLSVSLSNGIRTWQRLGLPLEGKDYLLHLYEPSSKKGWVHLLLINRAAFHKVVNENLPLFKYVLGPQTTSETLLEKLTDPKEDFYSVLKQDKVLVGILLGFGVNNALHINRQELIEEALTVEISPTQNGPTSIDSIDPSFGYSSLFEEYNDIDQKTVLSSKHLEQELPKLYFGCVVGTEETKALISHYEATQRKIIKVLESENFVAEFMSRFYGINASNIALHPKIENLMLFDLPRSATSLESDILEFLPIDWSKVAAHSIWNEFVADFLDNSRDLSLPMFIAGMQAADQRSDAPFYVYLGDIIQKPWQDLSSNEIDYFNGFRAWAHFKAGKSVYTLDRIIQNLNVFAENKHAPLMSTSALHNLTNRLHRYIYQKQQEKENLGAEKFFKGINDGFDPRVQCIVKDRLYYKPMIRGNGEIVQQNGLVKLRYKIKTLSGYTLSNSINEIEDIDLSRTMYGLRKGLTGLSKGTKGILYIHPEWGVRGNWDLPSIRPFLIIEFEIIG